MMELEGHVLGSRYKVQRKIQSGYFGTTWTARDLTTRGTVCVKVWGSACSYPVIGIDLQTMFTLLASLYLLSLFPLSPSSFILSPSPLPLLFLKTFICDSENQRKELAVLKELCDGHFNHENICSILDVCVKKSPVTTVQGT